MDSQAVAKKPEALSVHQQCEYLDKSVSALTGAINDLGARLVPLLRPDPATDCEKPVQESKCPLTDILSGFVNRVDNQTELLRQIITHLEI